MSTAVILENIQVIFRDVLRLPDLLINTEQSAWNIEGWDSLAHMQILLEIENHFEVDFTASESLRLKCIGDLVHLVQAKING